MIKTVFYAAVGFLMGVVFGLCGYAVAFLFTDALKIAPKVWNAQGIGFFQLVMLICVTFGTLSGVCLGVLRANREEPSSRSEPAKFEVGPNVWPPAPKQ